MMKKNAVTIGVIGGVMLAIIALGLWQAYKPKREVLQGMVDADRVKASTKVTARIAALYVVEGQQVAVGEPLFLLDSPEVIAKRQQVDAVVNAAQAQANKAQEGARVEDVAAAKAQALAAKTQADFARASFTRLDNLYRDGVIARQMRDEAKAKADGAQAQYEATRAVYEKAEAGARVQDKTAAGAQVEQALGAKAEVVAAENELRSLSPCDCEVSKRLAELGELVPAGYPVFTLVKTQDLWVSVFVREDQFYGLAVGDELAGEVPALDASSRFRVDFISPQGDYATWRASGQSQGFDVKTFEVRLRPLAPLSGLRPGMSVLFKWPQALQ